MASLVFDPADPEWLAHRHVDSADAIRFIHVPRGDRREVPFLTDAKLGDRAPVRECSIAAGLASFERPALAWIFHSAFCGSTLLAHAFDSPGAASSLSEPMLLNDVVGLRRRGAAPPAVARLADAALRLLGRPYPGEAAVVVKPSNVVNPLAELLLALQPNAPAIFLYAPLETFLLSVARKGLECRLWVRELLEGYLKENYLALGFDAADYFRQTDLQVAAIGWLAQHGHFARLAGKLGPGRLRMLDADRMLADPERALAAAASHFGLALHAAAVAAGPVFRRNSKSGTAYSKVDRQADYAAARASHGEEIELVLEWAERVAAAAGIALDPPPALRLI
jgi:hypothetical protein